ncbi:hypothetical protein ACHWQZ_G001194 [Mnemiopsis leidyi]
MKLKLVVLAVVVVQTVGVEVFQLLSQPASVTVAEGNPFNLTCVATAGDNKFQWFKEESIPNGVMTTPYTGSGDPHSAILSISSAEKSHGGFYQCRVISGDHVIYSDVAAVTLHYFTAMPPREETVTVDTATDAVRTTLPCDFSADISSPGASVKWYKDNILVEKANAFVVHANTLLKVESLPSLAITDNSLVLFNIKKDMAGQYRCEAAVDSDHISIKKQTVVTYNLAVNKEFQAINYSSTTLLTNGGSVMAGESVTLCCGTVGYLDGKVPTYTWFTTHGAEAVEITTGLTDFSRTLIVKATESHSYSCRSCLGDSCQSSVVTASVSAAPTNIEFTTAPTPYYLYEDGLPLGAVSLTCITSLGKGNWIKDGVSVSFPIDQPKPSHSGIYQCYARNSDSWVMKSTQLLVTQKLSVSVTAPSELNSSTPGTFSCTVGGYPAPDVTVTKTDLNDEETTIAPCSGDKKKGCSVHSGSVYTVDIDSTDLNSSGTYTCKVHHSYRLADGSVVEKSDKKTASIAIVAPVDVYSLTTKTGNLQFGSEATFTCNVKGGRAPHKIEMKFGSTIVYVFSNNNNEPSQGVGTCVGDYDKTCFGKITSVNYGHEGVLTCTGYNVAANSTTVMDSMSLNTTVTRSTFVEVTGDFFPLNNADLILTCTHHEKPLSFDRNNVTWYQDGKSIVPDSTVSSVSNGLGSYYGKVVAVFNSVTANTEGLYTCQSEGITSAGVNVYVGEGFAPSDPKMTVPEGLVGVPMEMKCESEGYPPPDLMWTIYQNQTVANITEVVKEKTKTTSTLTWTPEFEASMKIYCKASNVNGTKTTNTVMKVLGAAAVTGKNDSETAAIIAASVIGAIILLMCIIFLLVAICKHRRAKKHDQSDSTVIENKEADLKDSPYASVFTLKKYNLKGNLQLKNPFTLPRSEPTEETKPDKSQYAEIIGEVKNKENINQELDYDDKSTGDQIILNPTIVKPAPKNTDTSSSSSSSSRSSSSGTGSLVTSRDGNENV